MMIVTLRGLAAIAAASLFAGLPLAAAQEPAAGGSPPWQAPAGAVGSDVGTGWNILQIPASAFAPLNGTMSYTIDHDGYLEYGPNQGFNWTYGNPAYFFATRNGVRGRDFIKSNP